MKVQNPAKSTKWGKLARNGEHISWILTTQPWSVNRSTLIDLIIGEEYEMEE
jgi:hypothetical protein